VILDSITQSARKRFGLLRHRWGAAMLALLPAVASAQVLCFGTTSSTKMIRLQLMLPREGAVTGFVR
jgi:hypothetical protein